jgi:hypothetical protein
VIEQAKLRDLPSAEVLFDYSSRAGKVFPSGAADR